MAARKLAVKFKSVESNRVWGDAPAQGVFGDARLVASVTATRLAQAQANFDRPGGDYLSCRYPQAIRRIAHCSASAIGAAGVELQLPDRYRRRRDLLLKSNVPPRSQDNCCISGVAAPAWSNRATGNGNLDRPVRRRLPQFRIEKRRRRR